MILLDLGGTHIRVVTSNREKILNYQEFVWRDWPNDKKLDFIKKYASNRLAFSFAGIKHESSVYLPSLELSVPLSMFSNLVAFENDVNLVALAYQNYGNVLAVCLGTGVGLGAVIDHEPILGNFGEIGHARYSENETYEDHFTELFKHKHFDDLPEKEQKQLLKDFSNTLDLLYNLFFPKVIVFHGSVAHQFFIRRNEILKYFDYPVKMIMSSEADIFKGLLSLVKMKKRKRSNRNSLKRGLR